VTLRLTLAPEKTTICSVNNDGLCVTGHGERAQTYEVFKNLTGLINKQPALGLKPSALSIEHVPIVNQTIRPIHRGS
jgi:hypothetical protein